MFRLLAAILRRLKAGAAACGMFLVDVFDACDQGVTDAWRHAFAQPDDPDVATQVQQAVAAALDGMATRTEARVRMKRKFSAREAREPSDLPVPKHLPPSRSSLPDVIDPRRDPQRWACLQALRYTARVLSGPGTCVAPDMSAFNPSQRARLESLTTKEAAAPVQREMLRRLGWEGTDGWWWPHRQVAPTVPTVARGGSGGGPAFRAG